jgi:oligoribonuclease (3'-5' exoribonuclease)
MTSIRKNPSPTKSTGGLAPVTPLEVDRVRRSVLDVVRKNMSKVRDVLAGNINWSNQQVRLFSVMLNKVMPDLHHSFNQHSVEHKTITELTIDELTQIAAKAEETEEETEEEIAEVVKEEIKDDRINE